MNKAGKYTVTVTYKDLTETYEITVIGDGLVSLAVENLKTEYFIGEELSFEGAVAKETFQSGKVADADLASYEVVIADSKGNEFAHAHNSYLQVAYNFGIIAGGIFLLICIISLGRAIKLFCAMSDLFLPQKIRFLFRS